MNGSINPVNDAMAENRPAKQTIRSLWLEEVIAIARQYPNSIEPWYLTLPGAEGRDIQLIIDAGLISLTEVNSIAEKDQWKIVAVEQNNRAVLSLQKKFIGLKIEEANFASLIRGEGQFAWPDGVHAKVCRAHIINLDLNTPLKATQADGRVTFPTLEWIKKLCQIHAKPPCTDWTLCLTLHGDILWPDSVNLWTRDFLLENFNRERAFADNCKDFLGEQLFDKIVQEKTINFANLGGEDLQKFIMVMVPKLITRLVHNEGWRVLTEKNLRYGGGKHAPMLTWIVRFVWDEGGTATPDALYKYALCQILSGVGLVKDDGSLV